MNRAKLTCVVGVTLLVVLGVVGVAQASGIRTAHTSSAIHGRSLIPETSPAGTYTFVDSDGFTATWTLKSNSSRTGASGTKGYWEKFGHSIALTITSSTNGSTGCIFLGVVKAASINSRSKPGPLNCLGPTPDTWYAVKT
jgi:hypothetical protein